MNVREFYPFEHRRRLSRQILKIEKSSEVTSYKPISLQVAVVQSRTPPVTASGILFCEKRK